MQEQLQGLDSDSTTATLTGREKLHSQFPRTISEFKERVRQVHPVQKGIEFWQLANDLTRGYFSSERLNSQVRRRNFLEGEEHLHGEATFIFVPGLAALRGSDFLRKMTPGPARNMVAEGTYRAPLDYLRAMGFDVVEVWTDPILNTGNIEKTVGQLRKEAYRAIEKADKPIFIGGHSIGGEEVQVLAAQDRELARKVDGFVLGGSPLPERVNSWVAEAFINLNSGQGDLHFVEEVIDFMGSDDYKKVNFVSIKDRNDCVLEGWAAGKVLETDDGHAAVFHNLNNLREIVNIANTTLDKPHNASLPKLYRETVPLIVSAV